MFTLGIIKSWFALPTLAITLHPFNRFSMEMKRHQCLQCEYKAEQKSGLQTHVKSVHEGQKFTCSHCDYRSPFLDISVCFFVDGGHIDMKFHPSRGCDQPIPSASPHDSWETSYRLHQVSCILQSGNSYVTSHHSHFKHQVPWGLSVSLLYGWWHTDSSASRSGGG